MEIIQVQNLSVSELRGIVAEAVKEALENKPQRLSRSMSKKDFASLIGKSISFVDQERRAGRLLSKKNGGTISISVSEADKYI